ncbi:hypothetical protein [Roseibium litorale]|uniref:G-protein coupled receptors family 1 profile domain-containing protein n=1 Tax=Roseibium litorale TaxID=2803841 RepID=A0ABR9CRC8_9HYPH|nr:hypothetical protein [Roseibium litorale]MBD8893430.1 hypothetical protein [Roseibium litorale]
MKEDKWAKFRPFEGNEYPEFYIFVNLYLFGTIAINFEILSYLYFNYYDYDISNNFAIEYMMRNYEFFRIRSEDMACLGGSYLFGYQFSFLYYILLLPINILVFYIAYLLSWKRNGEMVSAGEDAVIGLCAWMGILAFLVYPVFVWLVELCGEKYPGGSIQLVGYSGILLVSVILPISAYLLNGPLIYLTKKISMICRKE